MNVLLIGATSEIASAVAEIYAKAGANLFLTGRNPEALENLQKHLGVLGASAVQTGALDLNKLDSHDALLQNAKLALGNIDIIFIAPGILPADDFSLDEQLEAFSTNCNATLALAEKSGNLLAEQGKGSLSVISSVAGDRGRQSNYWYGAAKGAVTIFCEGLMNRLYKSGVSVTVIKPGFIDTAMTENFEKGPLWAKPHDIAPLITRAIEKRKFVAYTPGFWWFIMFIIRNIPNFIFKRMSL